MVNQFPVFHQRNLLDCGPSCLMILCEYYKINNVNFDKVQTLCNINEQGTTLCNLTRAAEQIGFRALAVEIGIDTLITEDVLPCILHWDGKHYVVLHRVTDIFCISNPETGLVYYSRELFEKYWLKGKNYGIAVLVSI